MIKKSLFLFIIFFIGYNIFVKLLPAGLGMDITVSDFQSNFTKSEVYLYDLEDIEAKTVLVGTSLTGKIKQQYISDQFFNLGLDGVTLFNSINILKKREALPKRLLVEVNFLFSPGNEEFIAALLDPENYYTAKYIPSSRNINKPLVLLRRLVYSMYRGIKGLPPSIPEQAAPVIPEDEVEAFVKSFNYALSEESMDEKLTLLKTQLEELEDKGVKIVFHELPLHELTCQSVSLLQLRKEIKERFPGRQYIEQPDCSQYKTFDNLHLTDASGIKYALHLKEALNL